jgi:hypothetical protein
MSHKLNSAIAVIGIDIGKNSFHVVGHDKRGAIMLRQKWSRGEVETRLANLPSCAADRSSSSRDMVHDQPEPTRWTMMLSTTARTPGVSSAASRAAFFCSTEWTSSHRSTVPS